MPRKGLIIFGHACDHYDVAALLNVQNDHIGVDGIQTLQQMAELKAEVLQRATNAVVINADDPLCLAMRARAGTDRHILVSRDSTNPAVREHRSQGGEAVFVRLHEAEQWIILAIGDAETLLMPVDAVPATMNGLLRFNTSNAMSAAALAWAQGIDPDTIRLGLGSFHSSVDQNPGRYNFIEGLPFGVLLDFAHNPDGISEVCSVTAGLPVAGRRLLCIVTTGSRHPAHFAEVAPLLAVSFDEFVLGCNPRDAANQPEYAGDDPPRIMLARNRRLLEDSGVAAERIVTEVDRQEAVRLALGLARPGDLVVLLAQDREAIPVIKEFGNQPRHA
jgi:cyanophycin synthetase